MNPGISALILISCGVLALIALTMMGARFARDAEEALTLPDEDVAESAGAEDIYFAADGEVAANTREPATPKEAVMAKKKATPLTERIHATLLKRGPATTDTLAQRLSVKAKLISPRVSELVAQGRVKAKAGDGGEIVYEAAPAKARK